jgi:hypothetical protein
MKLRNPVSVHGIKLDNESGTSKKQPADLARSVKAGRFTPFPGVVFFMAIAHAAD